LIIFIKTEEKRFFESQAAGNFQSGPEEWAAAAVLIKDEVTKLGCNDPLN